jgi:hypothetical protein
MTRRAAQVRQHDITRAIRAAKRAGLRVVKINPDGSIITADAGSQNSQEPDLAPRREIQSL